MTSGPSPPPVPTTATTPQTTDPSSTVAIDKWLGIVANILAPITVITGLCFYFGLVAARKYYGYFGVDANALGLTSADYVMRSVSVLYPLIVALLALYWVSVWVREYADRAIHGGRHPRVVRCCAWGCVALGIALTARGILGVTAPGLVLVDFVGFTPGALGIGACLLIVGGWAVRQVRSLSSPRPSTSVRRASQVAAGATVILALFWLTNIFATDHGLHAAKDTAAGLWRRETVVVLDTFERLYAPPEFLRETMLPVVAGQRFHYRYECFRTLEVRPDRVVLVPVKWSPENGYSLIVRFDDSSRITSTRYRALATADYANYDRWKCPEIEQ
ncbi:hypothetical protein QX204_17550 [Nocardia sp. PE-7]|uniref:hypothetical protein n=1 Tax=Nocardia sp. PE-7 TaxID=3058426 RepID=UPI00265B6D8C|nr:hypothetical protein [Nocardia sp. PE-7]WKG06924.1 hypothetical protein QX204_17550 [Nocardia sp. PE-7]